MTGMDDIVRQLEADILAERRKMQAAAATIRASTALVRKAERLLREIRRAYGFPEPPGAPVPVPTNGRPAGIAVIDEAGRPLYPCGHEGCPFASPHAPAVGAHRYKAHGVVGKSRASLRRQLEREEATP